MAQCSKLLYHRFKSSWRSLLHAIYVSFSNVSGHFSIVLSNLKKEVCAGCSCCVSFNCNRDRQTSGESLFHLNCLCPRVRVRESMAECVLMCVSIPLKF